MSLYHYSLISAWPRAGLDMVGKRKFPAVTGAGSRQSTYIVKSLVLENKNTQYISDELLLLV